MLLNVSETVAQSLLVMGQGMAGIFVVIVLISLIVALLARLSEKAQNDEK